MFRKALLAALMIIIGSGLTITAATGTAAASPSADAPVTRPCVLRRARCAAASTVRSAGTLMLRSWGMMRTV